MKHDILYHSDWFFVCLLESGKSTHSDHVLWVVSNLMGTKLHNMGLKITQRKSPSISLFIIHYLLEKPDGLWALKF